jgi:hypothetical protein
VEIGLNFEAQAYKMELLSTGREGIHLTAQKALKISVHPNEKGQGRELDDEKS